MKICVLEWICGGGMNSIPAQDVPGSLRAEGRAMLSTLVRILETAGAQVATAIDPQMVSPPIGDGEPLVIPQAVPLVEALVPRPWVELARQCDYAIVVAPEIDGILANVLRVLRDSGIRLLNCEGEFLINASDKRRTANCLRTAGINHPPTYSLEDTSANPLELSDVTRWIIKPYDGAGCQTLDVVDRETLQAIISLGQGAKLIAQPLLAGEAHSCSAIFDRDGSPWWMPLATQKLTRDLKYCGGRVLGSLLAKPPEQLLNRTIEALGSGAVGWVGVDLLYDSENEAWSVIEVNPRATTSMIGLAASSGDRIGRRLCEAFQGVVPTRIDRWQDIDFSAEGEIG